MSDKDWNIEKINQFVVNGIEENPHLDYKGPGAISKKDNAKKEISKDVSAFANSAGGVIIYGIKEYDENDKRHLPEKIDPINGQEYSKEWLEQIINTTISPRINNIKITPIQTSEKEENQLVFVVDIPKSNTAHQAKDKRYYKRYNFESLIMEDWEIKDIINRQQKIDLDIKFKTTEKNPFFRKFLLKSSTIDLDIWISNKGNKVAEYVDCFISGE